jgi:hypothetical protein
MLDARMTDPNPSAGTPAIDAVLSALERLAGDLRRRAEEAERRAEMERQAREAEAEARHVAEIRAAVAEQSAKDAIQRAEAAETVAKENVEQLRRELLAAIKKAGATTQAAAPAAARPDLHSTMRPEDPYHSRRDQLLPDIPPRTPGKVPRLLQSAPPRWNDAEHVWNEDEPGPSRWRRLFGRRRE